MRPGLHQASWDLRRQMARDQTDRRARGLLGPAPQPQHVPGVKHHTCRWPMWADGAPAPRPPVFCDAPVVPGRSWCPAHKARAYLPPWMRWEPIPTPAPRPTPIIIEELPMSATLMDVRQNDIQDVEPGGIARDRLRSIVERLERLEVERKGLSDDMKDIKVEAKSAGFDVSVINIILRQRRQEPGEVDEQLTLLDMYRSALGM